MVDYIKFNMENKFRGFISNFKENRNKNTVFKEEKIPKISKRQRNKNNIKSIIKIKRNSKLCNCHWVIIFIIILISMFSLIYTSKKLEIRKLSTYNFIILTIQGNGTQSIINEGFNPLPSSIQINENEPITENINALQEITLDINTIKLIWTSQLDSCQNMFRDQENITMIDLTNFDFSLITDMENFFEGCTSLK